MLGTGMAFEFTGSVEPAVAEHILILYWRAWHMRNDLIFEKGK